VICPTHPDDEWVEITTFGSGVTQFILANSGAEREIARARALYLADQLTVEELEAAVKTVAVPS
jgi:hypothetical protein